MESQETAIAAPKVRVLVADDEELIARTLATILELAGYEVCAVYGGDAAVKLLDLFKPDLILTDVSMPGTTGIEVASIAQESLPRCKILLFSGQASLQTSLLRSTGYELPFEFLTKPVHPGELLAKLREMLRGDKPALLIPIETDDAKVH